MKYYECWCVGCNEKAVIFVFLKSNYLKQREIGAVHKYCDTHDCSYSNKWQIAYIPRGIKKKTGELSKVLGKIAKKRLEHLKYPRIATIKKPQSGGGKKLFFAKEKLAKENVEGGEE